MRAALLACIAVLPLSGSAAATPAVASLPWLGNFTDATVSDGDQPGVASEPTESGDESWPGWLAEDEPLCAADAQPPLHLRAEVAPSAGIETVVATLTGGVRVINAEGLEVTRSAGVPCVGTADALEILAVGTVFRQRTIVLAITNGGRREQAVWIGVYRVGAAGGLDPLFSGVVETREDGVVRTGRITFLPGALIYRPPGQGDALWVFDPVAHAYTPRGPFDHEAEPHS